MAKSPRTPDVYAEIARPTRSQQLTMGLSPKKETTDGQAANPEQTAVVDTGDEPAQANGVRDAN